MGFAGEPTAAAGRLEGALRASGVGSVERLPATATTAEIDRALVRAEVLVVFRPQPDSAARLVERLCRVARDRLEPPEFWAVDAGPSFLPNACRYWLDPRLVYRHLTGGASTRPAARTALFLVRRGLHYVPTSPWAAAAYPRFRLAVLRSTGGRPAAGPL